MTDQEMLTAYIADMRFRNLLDSTIHVRDRYLKKFSSEVGFTEATEQKIVFWLGRPMTAKTRSMWISTLNSFYTWANHNQIIGTNPVSNVGKPRLHPRSPRPMANDDLNKAINNAEPKMKAWLMLGCLAGCRCMEIASLSRDDIREDSHTLRLLGKGSKERFVPLHEEVLDALQQYGLPDKGRLWDENAADVSRKGNRYLRSLNIRSTMHTLRHYFGTNVYRASKDLRLTQELMGHSSPNTTAGYAAADQSQAAGVVSGLSIEGEKR